MKIGVGLVSRQGNLLGITPVSGTLEAFVYSTIDTLYFYSVNSSVPERRAWGYASATATTCPASIQTTTTP